MRVSLIAVIALSLAAGAAQAKGTQGATVPTETTICLDVGGQSLPAVCKVPGSRLDLREDICQCWEGRQVTAPVCGPGERAPGENIALARARKLASADGSLIGDSYRGAPMCVAPRQP